MEQKPHLQSKPNPQSVTQIPQQQHKQTLQNHSQKSSKQNQHILPTFKFNNNNLSVSDNLYGVTQVATKDGLPRTKNNNNKPILWDCGSTLYDSFELNSLKKQLDSAIVNSSRTLSMPRLPSEDRRAPPPPPPSLSSKKPLTSKVSRSLQKLLRSVFRAPKSNHHPKPNYYDSSSPDPWFLDHHEVRENDKVVDGGRCFVVYEKPNGLSTIPEVPEVGLSPDIRSLVRKTMSDRFTAASDGIFCA